MAAPRKKCDILWIIESQVISPREESSKLLASDHGKPDLGNHNQLCRQEGDLRGRSLESLLWQA